MDGKHVVFGEVTEGYDVVQKIEKTPTDGSDRNERFDWIYGRYRRKWKHGIDWSDWNTQYGSAPATSVGPGASCPLGLGCVNGPGSTTKVSKVPSSGLICPASVGSSSTGQTGHYYDGCYSSVQQNKVTVTTAATPVTDKQTCTTVNGSTPPTCASNSNNVRRRNQDRSNVLLLSVRRMKTIIHVNGS